MRVVIAKVDETYFDGEAVALSAPGEAGVMTVLPNHMPLVSTLKEGIISVRKDHDSPAEEFRIMGGVIEIHKGGVTVIL